MTVKNITANLVLISAACLGLAFLAQSVSAQGDALDYPSSPKPSVITGQQVYTQNCSSCHGANGRGGSAGQPDFSAAAWSSEYAPTEVAAAALGQGANHPAAASNATGAWNATAYVWTLPLNASEVQVGQKTVQKAADKLKKGGLALLITKGGEIQELRSPSWIMAQKEEAIVELISSLAADEYNALNQEHQEALIDYIYASNFTLPDGWRE